ncbi:MAG: amidohydrolase family protein [Chloroflexota bacterium]
MIIALTNCLLIDGTGREPIENATVVVENSHVVEAGPGRSPAAAERILNLGGMAVLPGLINLHVHYGLMLPGALTTKYRDQSEAALAYRMAENAWEALRIGVTTTRSVGEHKGADFALREAIEAGRVPGPRMFTGGQALAVTGGHGTRVGGPATECDGPYEFRKAARSRLKSGADHVKIMISGGLAGEFEAVKDSQMAPDEIEAVVMAAHNAGKSVCAHSGAPQAMLDAIRAGVDCMEHGYFLNDEVASLMVEKETFLVPTICVSRAEEYMRRIGVVEWQIKKSLDAGEKHWQALKTAIGHGVRIGLGTDMLPADPNDGTFATYREMELLNEAGMSPMAVLLAATRVAADVVSAGDRLGSIEEGKLADLVACQGNPTDDIRTLRNMRLVMKAGEVIRHEELT